MSVITKITQASDERDRDQTRDRRARDNAEKRAALNYHQNFDPADAARWLGVSKTTVRLMLKDGRLPFSRVGRRIVIQLADLQALLASTRSRS